MNIKIFEQLQNLLNIIFDKHILYDKIYYVGGCVRDYILNNDINDVDLVVEKENGSKEFIEYLHKILNNYTTMPYNLGNYPIWQITFLDNFEFNGRYYQLKDIVLEVAETMDEQFHDINSRQRHTFFSTLEKDILRRDFTVNAGLMTLDKAVLYKSYNPTFLDDIKNGIIKCNDNVNIDKIFSDDPLRMLRGIIFSIRFNWNIEEKTKNGIIRNAERIKIVSKERIIKEINKVLNLYQGMYKLIILLDSCNLLDKIFPDIYHLKYINQQPDIRNIHLEGLTVYHHTLAVLRNTKPGIVNSLAALFHDVGKNEHTLNIVENKIRFTGHEKYGAELTYKILSNLKYSNEIINDVIFLILHHMDLFKMMNEKTFYIKQIRKFLREIGKYKEQLYLLIDADSYGTIIKYDDGTIGPIPKHFREFSIIDKIELEDKSNKKQIDLFNGYELMDLLDIKGKDIGIAKEIVLDIQDEYGYNIDKDFAKDLLIKRFKKFKEN